MANSIKFHARLLFIDGEVQQIDIWVHELYVADKSKGSSLEEAVREELGMLDAEDLQKAFGLAPSLDYEILFSGEVEYFQSNYRDSYGEWDSSLSLDEKPILGLVTQFIGEPDDAEDQREASSETSGDSETN